MITNTPMTLYNIISDTTYQRTVLSAVKWEGRKASNGMRTGLLASNVARVFISMIGADNYLKPLAWKALVSKAGFWTLNEGDMIVKGIVTDEIHPLIPAIVGPPAVSAVPAFTVANLKAKYDDVLQITSVDTFDAGSLALRHFEVGAK